MAWDEQAMEHATETIVWGLMNRDIHPRQIDSLSPEQLTDGFHLLTGTDPLPRTDDFSPAPGEHWWERGSPR